MTEIEKRSILGIDISLVNASDTIETIDGYIRDGRPHMVVTADSSCVVMAQSDRKLREIVNSADLVTPDSIGILWAAKRFGTPLPERVSGVDIVQHLCEKGATSGYRVYILGAAPGIADAASENLRARYPGLQIVGTHHGYFKPDEAESVVASIKECKPDILFVAMGIPVQEKWIFDHLAELDIPVSMGVGGTFDVISGKVKRAPKWMQRNGLEWFYRLASNPRKIRKCIALPVFILMVLRAGRPSAR
jgi:N-acetylglucosaminyldiphosphoundecaprenol N-acetyl-beta-D-mannosaminyltransferase